MKKYGKIVCGTLKVPQNYPDSIVLEGKTIYKPTEEQLQAAGYVPIEEKEPETPEGKIAIATYKYNRAKTKILQNWTYCEPETPENEVENGDNNENS